MNTAQKVAPSSNSMRSWIRRIPWLLIPVLVLSFSIANAQQLTATLSGTATDQTDARIPGATVTHCERRHGRQARHQGRQLRILFRTCLGTRHLHGQDLGQGLCLLGGNRGSVEPGRLPYAPNIHLKISSDVTAVTVVSGADAEVPVDNAEISSTLNNELVDSAVLTGRNAAELIKMMPGITFNNGGGAGSSFNSQTTGTNNGPAGNFSANGTQPYGSTAVILDGANLVDPGNAGTQIANINQDMVDSVKFLSASYGAEYAKGPAILQAFSKSGGQKYHGEGYVYARNTAVGYANDWYNNPPRSGGIRATRRQIAAANVLTPQSFYYVGGNVGGPISSRASTEQGQAVLLGRLREDDSAPVCNAPVEMNVPTAAQLSGDFTNPGIPIQVYNPANNSGVYPDAYIMPCNTNDGWQGCGRQFSLGRIRYRNSSEPESLLRSQRRGHQQAQPAGEPDANAANGWNNFGYYAAARQSIAGKPPAR
jgi:hypothetical protein